ncbi:mitosis initiation protein fs(1)Ya [Toxorhynchites rutilus septentrionalis]|uniref:mitosis initiation protein fs(1)Ya n=1 Tax=Toxorhynchites rutilus septentrionalis TaxID=329112 RepID=UPI0024798525|nr:mitosis initiation protein fs(1)Ya [Toxorhynchites rutilus septentrionalis]
MKIPSEVQCKTCSQVFCCAKCRLKHEENYHQEMHAIRQICYICNNRPFPLRIDTKVTPNNLLIEHILREHLPLRCNRCTKVFHTAADFKSIARCHISDNSKDNACHLEHNHNIPTILETATEMSSEFHEMENKENIDDNCSTDRSGASSGCAPTTAIKLKNMALLTTPQVPNENRNNLEEHGEGNQPLLTPLSMINLRWKRKSRQSFDSLLSTTNNLSAVNASESAVHVPSSPGKKLARTTSTPMIHGCPVRSKGVNESYTCAMGQISSIHSNSGSESDSRSDDITPASSTSYEINKVRAIIRSRTKVAATPLRQVMSKSIQRAIVEHGYYSKMVAPGTQRKMSFNSTASSGFNSTTNSPSRAPLDLRTTPVLKRSSSESSCGSHNQTKMASLTKAKSEDSSCTTLDETSQMSSVFYDTHQNSDSLNDSSNVDQENRDNHKIVEEIATNRSESKKLKPIPSSYHDTPKTTGGMLKKVISFTSPETTGHRKKDDSDPDDTSDVWSTPSSIPPRSYSCSAVGNSRFDSLMTDDTSDTSDDVFLPPLKQSKSCKQLKLDSPAPPNTGKLWTIVSNVIRLASRTDEIEETRTRINPSNSNGSESDTKLSTTLVQKAASFAGFLKNHLPGSRSHRSAEQKSSSESDDFSLIVQKGGKRRRTTSVYAKPYDTIGNAATVRVSSSPVAKRKRIQGRQPIERMRQNSWNNSASYRMGEY